MKDLIPELPASLCFDPAQNGSPKLCLRRRSGIQHQPIQVEGLIACPKWIHITFDALAESVENGHDLACLRAGRITALIQSQHRNPVLRRQQFRRHDDPIATMTFAKALINAKTAGQVAVLRRAARLADDSELAARADRCARDRETIKQVATMDALRGIEGIIARTYFGGWPRWLGLPSFQRIPRRAVNPINHLLDIGYSRLCQLVTLHLMDAGFDIALGILHADDARRPTLALDLMEPLRPLIVDRFVAGCYQDCLSAAWMAYDEASQRLSLTTIGRSRLQSRWNTWMYGTTKRQGQVCAIIDSVKAYASWMSEGQDLKLPIFHG